VSRPERPVPPPLEGNDRLITSVITAGFLVALVVLLVVRDSLAAADRWWIWVAAFGSFLGFFGMAYVPHLKRARERTAERRDRERASFHGASAITGTDTTVGANKGAANTGADGASGDVSKAPPR
jgi:hypothetical protein